MHPADNLKILGIISVVLTWLSIGYIMYVTPRELSRSISHHAALNKRPYYLFAIGMTISVVLMYIFMIWWLIPALLLPAWFSILVVAVIVLELVTTWIPLTVGWKYTAHQTCSYGAALLIPVLLFVIAGSSVISDAARAVTYAAIGTMFVFLCLFLFVKAVHKHYLLYQSLYVAVFHVALLAAVYIN